MRNYLIPLPNPAITLKWTLTGHNDAVRSVLWYYNGRQLFTGGKDRLVRRWDLTGATPVIEQEKTLRAWVTGMVLDPIDRDVTISCSDGTMHTWWLYDDTVRTGDDRAGGMITDLSGVGERHGIICAVSNGTVGVWAGCYQMYVRARGHRGRVTAISGNPAVDYIASGGEDQTVRIWSWEGNGAYQQLAELKGHSWYVSAVAWHPSGTWLVSGSCDETLCCWSWPAGERTEEHGRLLQRLGHLPDWVRSLHWSYDGQFLACGCKNGQVWIFRAAGAGQLELWGTIEDAHAGNIYAVRWSPKGRLLATASEDRTVKIWDVEGVGKGPPRKKRRRRAADDE